MTAEEMKLPMVPTEELEGKHSMNNHLVSFIFFFQQKKKKLLKSKSPRLRKKKLFLLHEFTKS